MNENVLKICTSLSEISKKQFSGLFDGISGKKDLVLQSDIIAPLEKICDVKWLRINGIEKIYKININEQHVLYSSPNIIYLIYPCLKTINWILNEIQIDPQKSSRKYYLVSVPQSLDDLEDLLEKHGLAEYVETRSLQWLPIHLDSGLMSLEIPHVYRDVFLEKSCTVLPSFARSIWQLCQIFGKPKVYLALGSNSVTITEQLDVEIEMRGSCDKPCGLATNNTFDCLFIMDRIIDYISPLLWPGIYAALLNEVYPVKCGVCEYKVADNRLENDERYIPSTAPTDDLRLVLDSKKDKIYDTTKYLFFPDAMAVLVNKMKQIAASNNASKLSSKNMSVAEMKHFVTNNLKSTDLARKHDKASETIIRQFGDKFEQRKRVEQELLHCLNRNEDFIQELLITSPNKYEALRLFCLANVINTFQTQSIRQFLDTFMVQYGYENIPLYGNLIATEFIMDSSSTTQKRQQNLADSVSKFSLVNKTKSAVQVAKQLKQLSNTSSTDNVDMRSPSYVFGGYYSPVVVQVLAMLLAGLPEVELRTKLTKLFGNSRLHVEQGFYPLRGKTCLVYVVGGVTYSEVAALKVLENITGATIVICSDKMITGNDIIESLLH